MDVIDRLTVGRAARDADRNGNEQRVDALVDRTLIDDDAGNVAGRAAAAGPAAAARAAAATTATAAGPTAATATAARAATTATDTAAAAAGAGTAATTASAGDRT